MSEKKSFEQSLQELKKIVQEMEEGNAGLENNLKLYEEGIKLYKECKEFINKAEKKIAVLNEQLKEEEYL